MEKSEKNNLYIDDIGRIRFFGAEPGGSLNTSVSFGAGEQAAIKGVSPWETSDFFSLAERKISENGFSAVFRNDEDTIELVEEIETEKGSGCFLQRTRVKNLSDMKLTLSRIAAASHFIGGNPWEEGRFSVYTCANRWQGEGQWRKRSLSDLGLYPATSHPWEKCVFRIDGVGSQSTVDFYPIVIVEDCVSGETTFFESEGAHNSFIEIGVSGGFNAGGFTVTIGGEDERVGFGKVLAPGEEYVTSSAVVGRVNGGATEAIGELIKHKRISSLVPVSTEVVFNDYMNCNWAQPTREKLIPLIDAAAKSGAEVFCIDDGWAKQGIWLPLDDKFGDGGLKGIIDYIRAKGMKAGVWFEFERTCYEAAELIGCDDYVLRRDGEIVAPHRPKLDMRCPRAAEFLFNAVDRVYNLGVRFIKNDHNNAEGVGCNRADESPAEGLKAQEKAFYDFIDELYRRYPDLEIENCGSGAMRSDNGTLGHFSLQSTSDQEDYRLYPSIAVGSLALMPCEKAGIWSYPYPLLYDNIRSGVIPQAELESFADGGQTEFNMVTSMVGRVYLSGRIDLCDEFNAALIREGIDVYKTYRDTLGDRLPAFPLGLKPIKDKSAHAVVLEGETDAIMAVWGLEQTRVEVEVGKEYAYAEKIYPRKGFAEIEFADGRLEAVFDAPYRAVIVKLVKKDRTRHGAHE